MNKKVIIGTLCLLITQNSSCAVERYSNIPTGYAKRVVIRTSSHMSWSIQPDADGRLSYIPTEYAKEAVKDLKTFKRMWEPKYNFSVSGGVARNIAHVATAGHHRNLEVLIEISNRYRNDSLSQKGDRHYGYTPLHYVAMAWEHLARPLSDDEVIKAMCILLWNDYEPTCCPLLERKNGKEYRFDLERVTPLELLRKNRPHLEKPLLAAVAKIPKHRDGLRNELYRVLGEHIPDIDKNSGKIITERRGESPVAQVLDYMRERRAFARPALSMKTIDDLIAPDRISF